MNAPQALHSHDHRHCIDDALIKAETVCAERGARMTPLRRRVLELVWDSHAPIGAYAIMDLLRAADDRAAAPPTVYRALEFLLDQGLVHKIESLNAFVGCDRPEERHISQFLICTSCKAAIELNDPAILQAVETSARQSGFSLKRLTIEAQGPVRRLPEKFRSGLRFPINSSGRSPPPARGIIVARHLFSDGSRQPRKDWNNEINDTDEFCRGDRLGGTGMGGSGPL